MYRNIRKGSKKNNMKMKDRITIAIKSNRKSNKRKLALTIIFLSLIFIFLGKNSAFTDSKDLNYKSFKENVGKITFTGDVSPSRYLKDISKKYGHDVYYKNIKNIWKDSDISIVNLEAALLSGNKKEDEYIKIPKKSNIYLDVEEKDIEALKNSGINLIGFANNHSMDYGAIGMEESLEIFDRQKIDMIGAGGNIYDAVKPYVKEVDGKDVAIMAISDVTPRGSMARKNIAGINSTRYLHMEYELEKMINKNDFNIVYIHWGTEYTLKPDKEIQELGRKFIDMGVDLVIGAHPHVLLPIEEYKDGMIVYSMGNLVFDQKIGRTTESAIGSLYLDGDNRYLEFVPIDIKNGVPQKSNNKRVKKRTFDTLTKELNNDRYNITEDDKLIIEF